MRVDIVIVNFNTRALLEACLESIRAHANAPGVTTIVVDNASHDGSTEMVRDHFPEVRLIALDENIGFGAANNRGFEAGNAPYVLYLNSDAALCDGALEALVDCLETHPNCALVGPRLCNPDGSFQASCRRFPSPARNLWTYAGLARRFPGRISPLETWLSEAEHDSATTVDMVSGACFLSRRDYIEKIGGFDDNLFMYEEELDLAYPARKRGLETRYHSEAKVLHHGGASVEAGALSGFALRHAFRSKYLCFRKHYGPLRAWLTYCGDRMVFQISARLHPEGLDTPHPSHRLLAACRRGWEESHLPLSTLRRDDAFFDA